MSMLTDDQQQALNIMLSGDNVFLSGPGGTGKSLLINEYLSIIREKDVNVMVCAPTGMAALNIGGVTLHRAFGAPVGPICQNMIQRANPTEAVEKADIIVIDEISMCRFDLFSYVASMLEKAELKKHKHIQLIVVGDFYQLPPVITDKDRQVLSICWERKIGNGYAFESPWWEHFHFRSCYLRQVIRQSDLETVIYLNKLRIGNQDSIAWFNQKVDASHKDCGIMLVPTNALADKINRDKTEALSGEARLYIGNSNGDVAASDRLTAEKLIMKTGMRVMALVNDCGNEYCNGSLGTVQKLREDGVIVRFDNGCEALITPYTWQIENYAVDLVNGETSIKKQKVGAYTQLHLCEPISPKYLITSTEVGMFYKLALDNAGDITHDTE